MITIEDLDGLKLVREENIADLKHTLAELEHAVTQGSQGWGVSEDHAVLLRTAGELRTALHGVAKTDEAMAALEASDRALKGKQMELGRARKQFANEREANGNLSTQILGLKKDVARVTKRHADMLDVSKAQAAQIAILTEELDEVRGNWRADLERLTS